MVVRQSIAILLLPCTMAVGIPLWIARRNHTVFTRPDDLRGLAVVGAGAGLLCVGIAVLATTVSLFWRRGRGTLAPWDPPRRFVIEGPYRYVRNPMISGVIAVIVGEACLLRSLPLTEWAVLFAVINAAYIPLLEEPMLAARFGEPYTRYTRQVRRFVPRVRGWNPDDV